MRKLTATFLVGAVVGVMTVGVSAGRVAAGPWVADSNAVTWLNASAWAYLNNVTSSKCTGIGAAHALPAATSHSSFRCTVEVGGKPGGTVVVKALGPESFQVTSVSGSLKPDHGLGKIAAGAPTMDSTTAATALTSSSWASTNHVIDAQCEGVGPYKQAATADLFGVFSCSTVDMFGSRGPQAIAQVTGKTVKVTQTLKR